MYIKQAGCGILSGKWVAFRDFKDGLIRIDSTATVFLDVEALLYLGVALARHLK